MRILFFISFNFLLLASVHAQKPNYYDPAHGRSQDFYNPGYQAQVYPNYPMYSQPPLGPSYEVPLVPNYQTPLQYGYYQGTPQYQYYQAPETGQYSEIRQYYQTDPRYRDGPKERIGARPPSTTIELQSNRSSQSTTRRVEEPVIREVNTK